MRAALLILVAVQCVSSATLQKLSLQNLTTEATTIARGRVSGTGTLLRGSLLYTTYSVRVEETLKGPRAERLTVAVPGGRRNGWQQTVTGAPVLVKGTEYAFFLWTGPNGLTQILGLTQGLLRMERRGGRLVATRGATTERLLDSQFRPISDNNLSLPWTALKARVLADARRLH